MKTLVCLLLCLFCLPTACHAQQPDDAEQLVKARLELAERLREIRKRNRFNDLFFTQEEADALTAGTPPPGWRQLHPEPTRATPEASTCLQNLFPDLQFPDLAWSAITVTHPHLDPSEIWVAHRQDGAGHSFLLATGPCRLLGSQFLDTVRVSLKVDDTEAPYSVMVQLDEGDAVTLWLHEASEKLAFIKPFGRVYEGGFSWAPDAPEKGHCQAILEDHGNWPRNSSERNRRNQTFYTHTDDCIVIDTPVKLKDHRMLVTRIDLTARLIRYTNVAPDDLASLYRNTDGIQYMHVRDIVSEKVAREIDLADLTIR